MRGCSYKKISLFFLLLPFVLNPVFSNASSDLGEQLTDNEKRAAIEQLNKLQKNINSITAKVSQLKKNKLLKKDIRSEGIVSLKKPNLMRWEASKPEKIITAIDGEKMTVYRPAAKEAEVYELSENIIARNTADFFSSSLEMSLDSLGKRFNVEIYRTPESIVLELKPKSKITSKYLTKINIWYNEKSGLPSEFEVAGNKGDITHTWIKDIVVNPDLKPEVFQLKLTDEVWITNKVSEKQY